MAGIAATKKKEAKKDAIFQQNTKEADDFTVSLIRDLNKERGDKVAYNLSIDDSPTHVKRWISTGIKSLDYICSNRRDGGLPEGRIIEIFGPPSIGKSHVAVQICKSVQRMGGIVVYIDSETATSVENLMDLGINVAKRFVYVNEHCTENILAIAESTILKTRAAKKDIPVVIVWDSVAASSPKAELEGEYDKETMGLQARAIAKGMRKITGVIGEENVLFVILNQMKMKLGVTHGDPATTPGGQAIPFHASIRIRLGAGQHIENAKKEVIGINVWAKTIKNKIVAPFRKVDFQIHFGVGIKEHEEIFDVLRLHGQEMIKGKVVEFSGEGAWKKMIVFDPEHPENKKAGEPVVFEVEKKFVKSKFNDLMTDPLYCDYINDMLEAAMVRKRLEEPDIDPESYIDMTALAAEIGSNLEDLEELSV